MDQPRPQFVCLSAVFRELLVPPLLLLLRVECRGDIFGIIVELEGIGDKERLARPEDPLHRLLGPLGVPVEPPLLHCLLGGTRRVDEAGPDLPAKERGSLGVVDRVLEHQPFEKGPRLPGRNPIIDGGADEDRVGCFHLPEYRRKVILHCAMTIPFPADPLAGEAAGAALVIQIVQVEKFGSGPHGFGTLQCMVKERSGVPCFPGASVEREDFHSMFWESGE